MKNSKSQSPEPSGSIDRKRSKPETETPDPDPDLESKTENSHLSSDHRFKIEMKRSKLLSPEPSGSIERKRSKIESEIEPEKDSERSTESKKSNSQIEISDLDSKTKTGKAPESSESSQRSTQMKRSKSLSPEPSEIVGNKRSKIDTEIPDTDSSLENKTGTILDFSDDVLLNILKHLNAQELISLSQCCRKLKRICCDRTLWKVIDFRNESKCPHALNKYAKFVQPSTTRINIRGATLSLPCKNNFLRNVRATCTNLKELNLLECDINGKFIHMKDFPETVEKLSFEGSELHEHAWDKSYFSRIHDFMPNLTCLILSRCKWVTSHSFLVISKIPNLKELRLDSCHRLRECVAYVSLATRFGFNSLEILDLRDTALGDSEICCFNITQTLTHLYLECPMKSPDSECRPQRVEQVLENAGGQQIYEDRHVVEYLVADDDLQWSGREPYLVSDRAVCAFSRNPLHRLFIIPDRDNAPEFLGAEKVFLPKHPDLKTLVVRNYRQVTNQSLVHLAVCGTTLEFLDVTGTSVTKAGVSAFKCTRPNVKLVSSFNEEC